MLKIGDKISHRFFVAMSLITLIPICVMGYQNYSVARKARESFAVTHMTTVVDSRVDDLNIWLEQQLENLSLLSRLPMIREAFKNYLDADKAYGDRFHFRKLLKSSLNLVSDSSIAFERIYIVHPDGHALDSTLPALEGDLKEIELSIIQQPPKIEVSPAAGPVYYLQGLGWHIRLTSRLKDEDGQTLAFIMVVLNISKMLNPMMIHREGLEETGEVYLVNKERRMITESRFLDRTNDRLDTFGIRSVLEQRRGTGIYRNYLDREVLGSYVWLPRYGLGMLAEMETDEIMAPLNEIKLMGFLTAGAMLVICLLIAHLVSQNVSRPINMVADASRRIAGGELDQRILFSGKGELRVLADSFNTMASQLSAMIISLRDKEESLLLAYNELIAAQKQLVNSEKMAAVGELVSSVAHEMRNPLFAIKLNLQIIGRTLNEDTHILEHYQIALDQVLQMERMFSDLLNYSRPLSLNKRYVLVDDFIDTSLSLLANDLVSLGITVEKKFSQNFPPILFDPERLQQVLVNLLKNAMEAVEEDRRIEISASLQDNGEEPRLNVTVRDHGVGIASKNLQNVCQPFFTTKRKGTGLGLSIAKRIIDAHQGDIHLSSEEHVGTEITFTIPVDRGLA
jgi:signal transduction histidine kinase